MSPDHEEFRESEPGAADDEQLRIPEAVRGIFAEVARLEGGDLEAIRTALSNQAPTRGATGFARAVLVRHPGMPDLDHVITAVIAAHALRRATSWPFERVTRTIAASADLDLSTEERDALARALRELGEIEALFVSIRAEEIVADDHHVFSSARTVTDLRPVFGPRETHRFPAAVITHELDILYSVDGEDDKHFRVALGPADFKALRDALERAEQKAAAIKETLKRTGTLILDSPAEDRSS